MIFNSFSFLFFFLILALVLAFTHEKKYRHIELLVASYIFYGCWDWRFCSLLLGVTVVAYICSKMMVKCNYAKIYLIIGVVFPIVALCIFKYFNFFLNTFCSLFGINGNYIQIILPVGISFYTFQAISYIADVYKKKIDHCESFVDLALYISFFPQLVAGPIVRAVDFLPQLKEDRRITFKNLELGSQIFLLGLFKKIVIADHIAVFVDEIYARPGIFNGQTILLSIFAYSIQIYCDFSGYSDMAIGCAKCIGYDLRENFNIPYISKNISEFWKRWHISLSNWLMEYLYIPLGGNRKGLRRTLINLMITMLLGGLWHGASWNFVIWGGIHGAALCIHKIILLRKTKEDGNLFYSIISVIITFSFVSFVWVFFRADSIETAIVILTGIFRWKTGISHMFFWAFVGMVFVAIETTMKYKMAQIRKNRKDFSFYLDLSSLIGLTAFFTAIGFTLGLAYVGSNPFIYFQF